MGYYYYLGIEIIKAAFIEAILLAVILGIGIFWTAVTCYNKKK